MTPQINLGQDVLYTLHDGLTDRPGKVVRVVDADAGVVNLQVFVDGSNDVDLIGQNTSENILWQTSVPYSAAQAARTWRFPEHCQVPCIP
jgi:hypothetical protein